MWESSEKLINIINSSDSDELIESETKQHLKIADSIIVAAKNNPELKDKLEKEHDILKKEIEQSVLSDNQINQEELGKIRVGVHNIVSLASEKWINLDNENNIETLVFSNAFIFWNTVAWLSKNKVNDIIDYLKNNDEQRAKFLEIQDIWLKWGCPMIANHRKILTEVKKFNTLKEVNLLKSNFSQKFEKRFNWEKYLVDKLFNNLEVALDENICFFDLLEVFDDFVDKTINEHNKNNNNKQIEPLNEKEKNDWISLIIKLKQGENQLGSSIIDTELLNGNLTDELFDWMKKNDKDSNILERVVIVWDNITEQDKNLIRKMQNEWKSKQEIMNEVRKQNTKLDEELKIYEQNIKNWVSGDADYTKNNDSEISYYLKNQDQIYNINDENFLLKIIKEYKKENSESEINLLNINPSLRSNINILSLLDKTFNDSEILSLNKDFFKNFDNLVFILKNTSNYKIVLLIMEEIFGFNNNLLLKLNELLHSEKLILEKENIISEIPLKIIYFDKDHIIWLNEFEFGTINGYWINLNSNKIKEKIKNYLNKNNDKSILTFNEDINIINIYIENYWIKDIKEEIKLLIDNWYFNKLNWLYFILKDNIDLAEYAIKKDIKNMKYIPLNLRWDEKIISALINCKTEDMSFFEYIEFYDINSIVNFIKLAGEKWKKFLYNEAIQFKIKNVLKNINIDDYIYWESINNKDKEILINLLEFFKKWNENSEQIKKIRINIENTQYKNDIEKIINAENISTDDKKRIINLLALKTQDSQSIYETIVKIYINWWTEKDKKININKAKELIKKLHDIDIIKTEKQKNIIISADEDSIKWNNFYKELVIEIDWEKKIDNNILEKSFIEFRKNNPKKDNEQINNYEQRIIEEYLQKLNIKNQEHKSQLKEIILAILKLEKLNTISKNYDKYFSYISWETTKEEYEKEVKKNENKNLNSNIKPSINLDNYNFKEENYIKTDSWYVIESPTNWEKITISEKEKKITQNNPEALKNLVNFHDIFVKLNLESVWKYRVDLAKSMWDVNINLEDDSLKEIEIIKVCNYLIKFINNITNKNWEKLSENINTLSWVKNELQKYSWANSMLSDEETYWIYWNDRFEYDLRRLWIIWNSLWFQNNKFNDIMKWKNSKT